MEQVTEQDLAFLRQAIELARKARNDGRHPFGALIVNERGETVVAARNNAVRPNGDPTQHAEMLATQPGCSTADRSRARQMHSIHQHRTLRYVRWCDLLDRHRPCCLCAGRSWPVRATPAAIQKIPPSICLAAKSLPGGKSRLSSLAP